VTAIISVSSEGKYAKAVPQAEQNKRIRPAKSNRFGGFAVDVSAVRGKTAHVTNGAPVAFLQSEQ